MKLTFVTWLWSGNTMPATTTTYVADHVNRMASMIRRHCTLPHEIVCVTDMPEGIDSTVRTVALWPDLCEHSRCFRRLKMFDPVMAEIFGPRIVSIDLDTVITANIDHLFQRDEPFVIWRGSTGTTPYCGSLWMLDIGYRPDVFHSFDYSLAKELRAKRGFIGSDQAWMAYMIEGAATWDRVDGVYSFRHDIQMRVPMRSKNLVASRVGVVGMAHRTGELKPNACIVFFHGKEDPSQTHLHIQHKWISEHWR